MRLSHLSFPLLLMTVFLINSAQLVSAEGQPEPTPAPTTEKPKPVDAETIKKAEAAADAYLQKSQVKIDPEAALLLADIEVILLESQAYLDAGSSLKAGEKYLEAIAKRKNIPIEQRTALGERFRKADRKLLALSRTLLGDAAFDPGESSEDKPAPSNTAQPTDQAQNTPPDQPTEPVSQTPPTPPTSK